MANILIVDDDARLARQLVDHFSAAGHACRVETSAESALACLGSLPFDLLVLDVMLPRVSGFEVCRRVRAHEAHFTVPIIMISAMSGEEEIMHGLAQGADDYLTKPLNINDLLRRANRLLATGSERGLVDDITDLPGSKTIRLEVQKAINRREAFGLIYVEMINIHDFSKVLGSDARSRALRHMARGLQAIGNELNLELFRVGHMGGGHFVCLVSADKTNVYCQQVQRLWQQHLQTFYQSVGQERAFIDAMAKRDRDPNAPLPILDTLFCVTTHDPRVRRTAQDLFDTLSHIREGAQNGGITGIYSDRRQ